MRYFECRQDGSRKFWAVERRDCKLYVAYGRIGSDGSHQVLEFDSEEKALRNCERRVQQRLKSGYREQKTLRRLVQPGGRLLEVQQLGPYLYFYRGEPGRGVRLVHQSYFSTDSRDEEEAMAAEEVQRWVTEQTSNGYVEVEVPEDRFSPHDVEGFGLARPGQVVYPSPDLGNRAPA
ncbi:MAG: WGR domain-containing protein [Candidatus Eremiobacterota bacterium]